VDKATIFGILLATFLIAGAMLLGGSLLMYWDTPSVLIVFGGTFATTLIKESFGAMKNAFSVAKQAMVETPQDVDAVITRLLDLAKKARESGVLALESEKMPTPFMAKGLRLVCDGISAEEILETLHAERLALLRRHKKGRDIFKFMAGIAPSMGMIGTLVGLVAMLQTLDNPSAIGPAMATALLTTLYGALIAFVVCQPVASKLEGRTNEEAMTMEVALQGLAAIARGDRPMIMRERLESYLLPKVRAAKPSE
jgi:chemotaxis protein MotA